MDTDNRSSSQMATWIGQLVTLLILATCLVGAYVSGGARLLDTQLSDVRYSWLQRPASGEIVLVDIDAKSLAEVGVWPWPRRLHAAFLKAAAEAGARRVAFDVDFSSRANGDDDEAFAEALGTTGLETFLAAFVQYDAASGTTLPSLPIPSLLAVSWPASINVPIDADGRVRRFPLSMDVDGETIISMPAVLAGRQEIGGDFGIDHGIAAASIPRISYVDLVGGRIAKGLLAGKTLIVGATAIELHDLFPVPRAGIVSGSTVIALATESLMQERALTSWRPPLPMALLLLVSGGWLVVRNPLRRSVLALAGASVAIEGAAAWLYIERAVMAETAELQLAIGAITLWSLVREFDLRQFRLWVSRVESRNMARLLERVVDDGFDAIVIVDEQGVIKRINEVARRLLDLPRTDRVGELADLPTALVQAIEEAMSELDDVATGRPPVRRTVKLTGKDDACVLEYTVSPFWLEDRRRGGGEGRRLRYASLLLHDVTDRETAQEQLRFAAFHDSLTGLPNRRALEAKLDELAAGNSPVALLAFDLDRFKGVNDALGHATGDAVLVETARRATSVLPSDAAVFRIGGDEFLVLVRSTDGDRARRLAERIVQEVSRVYEVNGHRVSIGTCVGIATANDGGIDPSVLRRQSDVALYQAKRTAAGPVVEFDLSMDTARLERLALERDLAQALEIGAFELAYQPQASLQDDAWTGAEALIRWRHPERGFVSPADFIPVAEETGMIHKLGAWVLHQACQDALHWPEAIKIAVNVSPLQFLSGDIVGAVHSALASSGLDPQRLELEITESAFVGENHRLSGIFDELLALGVSFALDDFGTGYSSLGYLHRFPIAKIKIDRSFVTDIPESRHSMAVLRSVVVLARGLGIRTIAEGVETASQAAVLREIGCGEVQGYLYSKPLDIVRSTELFEKGSRMRRIGYEKTGDLLRAVG
ncbi:EAL domain-containing protein [Aureimonas pseudogalii]|uniref:Diguanylate cyclase (GGDEF)-like protein n=1 Tax=Aureimonas pseudogalii TaxID=1744844 RepID=A0A7W6H851_9HYPH|nr:EAL domain-containing protein [Aureimonas pseudogalii]MBB4000297.1 diguanylate cyclase (GGDEF)-like protein [Aureimonas pseudogalii]